MLFLIEHLAAITGIAIGFALLMIPAIYFFVHRLVKHPMASALSSTFVSVGLTILFTFVLNNLYSVKRDRDSRLRAFRDRHFEQLKPVLRKESGQLHDLARMMGLEGHVDAVVTFQGSTN